jgi:hemoglobin-like flavoprotein
MSTTLEDGAAMGDGAARPDKELLLESLGWASELEEVVTLRFYEILFERYPQVRPLFSRDRSLQARMLQDAVVAAVAHLDDAAWLSQTLGAIGAKHVDYGVTDEMYPLVGECLIAALAEPCGPRWTPAHEGAWARTCGARMGLALQGAARRRAEAAG